MVEIELDLTSHCIETELKRIYDAQLSQYLALAGENHELESRLGLVQSCLESFNFSSLRGRFPELAGGNSAHIVVKNNGEGTPGVVIDGRSIDIGSVMK